MSKDTKQQLKLGSIVGVCVGLIYMIVVTYIELPKRDYPEYEPTWNTRDCHSEITVEEMNALRNLVNYMIEKSN